MTEATPHISETGFFRPNGLLGTNTTLVFDKDAVMDSEAGTSGTTVGALHLNKVSFHI